MSGAERVKALEEENAALRAGLSNLDLLLAEARESGKAARRLAKHAMEANGVQGAHVVLKATPRGVKLIICSPPAENEEALGAAIAKTLNGLHSWLEVSTSDVAHTGVKES